MFDRSAESFDTGQGGGRDDGGEDGGMAQERRGRRPPRGGIARKTGSLPGFMDSGAGPTRAARRTGARPKPTGPRLADPPARPAGRRPKRPTPAGSRSAGAEGAETGPDGEPWLLVAGDAFEDLIFAGLPRLPRPGEEIRTTSFTRTVGGGAVISAAWGRAERLQIRLVSPLPPGVEPFLGAQGIECRDLRRADEHHAVTACLSFGEERSFATFAPEIPGTADRLREALGGELTPFLGQPDFGALLLAHLPTDPPGWARWTQAVTRGEGRPEVFWDFGYDLELARRPGFPDLVQAADGVFVNRQEADLYRTPLRRAAKSGTLVIVKLGAKGAEVLDRPDTRVPAPLPLRGVRDTTGAGDAFNAGFLARRLRGGSLGEQIAAGNALGAQCVQRVGGLPATPWGRRPARRPSLFDGKEGGEKAGERFRKGRRTGAADDGEVPRLRPVGGASSKAPSEEDAEAGAEGSGGGGPAEEAPSKEPSVEAGAGDTGAGDPGAGNTGAGGPGAGGPPDPDPETER